MTVKDCENDKESLGLRMSSEWWWNLTATRMSRDKVGI